MDGNGVEHSNSADFCLNPHVLSTISLQKLRNLPQSVSSLLTSIAPTIRGLLLHVYDSRQGRHGWINEFLPMWPLLTRYHSPRNCHWCCSIDIYHCRWWCPVYWNEAIERYDTSRSQWIHISGVMQSELSGSSSGVWDEWREGICLPPNAISTFQCGYIYQDKRRQARIICWWAVFVASSPLWPQTFLTQWSQEWTCWRHMEAGRLITASSNVCETDDISNDKEAWVKQGKW